MACPPSLPATILFSLSGCKLSMRPCPATPGGVFMITIKKASRVAAWSSHNPEGALAPLAPLSTCAFANLWLPNPTLCSFGNLAPHAVIAFTTQCGRRVNIGMTVTGVVSREGCGGDRLTLVGTIVDACPELSCRPLCGSDVTMFVDGAALSPNLLPLLR